MKGEIIISGVTLLSGFFLYYIATTFPDMKIADKVGPAFWPKILSFLIIVFSGYVLLKNSVLLLRKRQASLEGAAASQKDWRNRLIMTMGLSILYGFSVSYLGFLLSVFLFQIVQLFILKVKKVLVLLLYPLTMTVVFYIIFIQILHIPLPRGAWIFIPLSRLFY